MNNEKVETPERIVETGGLKAGQYRIIQKGNKNEYQIIDK